MVGRIIGMISCLLCAIPFEVIAKYNCDSDEPISFWSGDSSLRDRVLQVADYNREMAVLYRKYAISWVIAALLFLIYPMAGVILCLLDCSVGIYLVYRAYKKILNRYS